MKKHQQKGCKSNPNFFRQSFIIFVLVLLMITLSRYLPKVKYLFLVASHIFLPGRKTLNNSSFKETKIVFVGLFSLEKIYSVAAAQWQRRN